MAESSTLTPSVHRVWTFLLLSGPSVQITLPGSPSLDFQGRRTHWKIVASEAVADDALRLFRNLGIRVERYIEEENAEMLAEREKYQGK